jgi:hypothetical protein
MVAIVHEHVLSGFVLPTADLRVWLLVDGVECVWARSGKCDFWCDLFPVEALPVHVCCGVVAGELWLHNVLLVVLGLCTMCCAAELAVLQVGDVTWLPDWEHLCVFVCSLKVDQAGCGFEIFVELTSLLWYLVKLHCCFMQQCGRPWACCFALLEVEH